MLTEAGPTFDANGYPTQETLRRIEQWPEYDLHGLFEFVRAAWNQPENCHQISDSRRLLHTGGWSGNEDLIAALKRNHVVWALTWYSTRRGGHYEFEV